MASSTSGTPAAPSIRGGAAKATDPKGDNEAVDPMIPHTSREDADLEPGTPKHTGKGDVVEPMIPHNKRQDME